MKILVACEFSGVVRDAFAEKGWDAWSCDLLPSETPGNHIVGDALEAVKSQPWDLLIAHPPCTYLCNSGVRWLSPGGVLNMERHRLMVEACDFFAQLYHANIPKVCVENPIMHKYARDYLASAWKVRPHSQIVHPYYFGDPFQKATCLWLNNLRKLVQTCVTKERKQQCWLESPGPDRWKNRSRTYRGIAEAMAGQFSDFIASQS